MLHDHLIALIAKQGWKNGTLLWPVRIALCGKLVTRGGAIEAAALMGKEEVLRRLMVALEKLQ